MARKEIGTGWNRDNRNNMNDNFKETFAMKQTADDAKSQAESASTTANTALTNSEEAKTNASAALQYNVGKWLPPVGTFDDIDTDHPNSEDNDRVWTRDTGKAFVYRNSAWEEFMEVNETQVNEVDTRLSTKINQKAPWLSIEEFENLKVAIAEGYDWTPAYQEALTNPDVKLMIPPTNGYHYITSPINVNDRQVIAGSGMNTTKLRYTGTSGACFQAPPDIQIEYVFFRDLKIEGDETSGTLIDMNNLVSSSIDFCYLSKSSTHVVRFRSEETQGNVGYYNGLNFSVLFNTPGTGRVISVEKGGNSTKIIGNRVSGGQYGLYVENSDNIMVQSNSFESTSGSTTRLLYTGAWKTQVIGNRFEGGDWGSSQYLLEVGSGATYADVLGNFYSGTLSGGGNLNSDYYILDNGIYTNQQENQPRKPQKAYRDIDMNGQKITVSNIEMTSGEFNGGGRTMRNLGRIDLPSSQPGNPVDGTIYVDKLRNRIRFYEDGEWRYTNTLTLLDSLPAATENNRGWTILVKGNSGSADQTYVCVKNSGDTYEWKTL